ncbi:MAG: phosphoenolpyruvate--protein phosphotransferase [Candidatus Omnitrophica bacterium]|nr:phosphoenolpyruvate--protein phosphotransferase [Candidatus Omnitrophota bacterium]
MNRQLIGIPVSPGVAIAKALVLHAEDFTIPEKKITQDDVPKEIARFEDALTKTRQALIAIRKKIADEIGAEHSDIFNAHLLILEDRTLIEDVIGEVKTKCINVEAAFSHVIQKYYNAFHAIDDEYLRERVSDVRDIGRRVLHNLLGRERAVLIDLAEPTIVVAHDISPTDTAAMDKEKVVAFATEIGGPTSHTAIMARSLGIPAVVGVDVLTHMVKTGDLVAIDGSHGLVIVEPDQKKIEELLHERERYDEFTHGLERLRDLPAETKDKKRIVLQANIEIPDEIPSVIAQGAEGIGLYRTEFFYMNRTDLPTEDEQYQAYRYVAEQMKNHSVVIRTIDFGGDKFLSSIDLPYETNPFLGWRAIRFCLARVDIFKTQLRAILRASAHGKIKVMFPMISNLNEMRRACQIVAEAKAELKVKNMPFDEKIPVGAMIEIPSAALISDKLAQESDFFSIGTNDLIQYSLAVDRINEKIAYLYEPTHPAILRMIQQIVENAHKNKIEVAVCGEMSSDMALALLLIGFGVDELSMSPFVVPKVKKLVRSVTMKQARDIAAEAMHYETGAEIRQFADSQVKKVAPELMA